MRTGRRRNQQRLLRLCSSTIEAMESRVLLSGSTAGVYFYPTAKYVPVAKMHLLQPDSGGFSSPAGGTTPSQMRQAYGVSSISFNGTAGDGSGQTIAIIDAYDDPNAASDLTAFDAYYGLANPPSFTKLNQNGQTSPLPGTDPAGPNGVNNNGSSTWEEEESLDIEWAHVMAPKANIVLYEANSDTSLYSAITTANSNSSISVMSMSFGGNQSNGETSDNSTYFSRSGITYLASTGDSGTPAGDPATLANVVAVGGTTMHQNSGTYSSESGWSGSGGGVDKYDSQPSYQSFTVSAKSTTKRTTPDVSIEADPNTGVPIYDSWDFGTSTPWIPGYEGGTSLSSPMWAGLVAIADQGRALNGLGSLTGYTQTLPRLYQLPGSVYHDITSGNNGLAAGAGYDLVTGIGSPIANTLVPDLAGNASITGRMFVDNGNNGIYGGTDTPLAGKTVYLDLNNDGTLDNGEPSTTTNSSGGYLFTDQPAGGSVRLSSVNISGYALTSAASASITYGSSETVNFTYQSASKLAFTTQPPASTPYGSALTNIVVNVEALSGGTIFGDSSSVTLTLSSGTFSTGSSTATATASNGIATFGGLHINALGSYTVTASDGALSSATSNSFSIVQATPTVSWSTPASITYGTALSGTQLNATASVPGTFVYSPAAGTVLNAGSGQTLHVTFTPTDSTDYSNASGSTTITVTQAQPTVSWSTPSSITYGSALSGTQLNATASVPGTFVYTPAAGTVLTAGTQNLSVVFHPTDSTDYNNANGATTIVVAQATPTVTWNSPASITYGTALSGTQLNASAGIAGTFVYTPAAGTILTVGTQSLNVVFHPTDSTDYKTANGSTSITVIKTNPTVSWSSPAAITYGTALSSAQLNATTGVAGTFVYTPAAGTVLTAGNGKSLSVTFTPTDTTDYNSASGSTTINVLKATPGVTWAAPSSIVYGTALSGTQLNANASVPGTFVYTPAAGTVLTAGSAKTLSVAFTPADTTDYANANGSTSITVTKVTPTVSWSTPSDIVYGTALSSTQLDASPSVPGTLVYTPAAGTVLGAGSGQALSVSFTPSDSTDYTSASGSTTINVQQATPTINWANPASITYGTALDGTQLNATAGVPGNFAYNPSAGTVLNPGANQSLGVLFTPTDTTDYTAASDSVLINVTGTVPQPINLTGSSFYLKLDNASPQNLDIWTNATESGAPEQVVQFNTISSISISATANGDSFVADFSNGSIIPSGGLNFSGSGVAANNSLTIVGSGGNDTVTVPGDGTVNINSQVVNYSVGSIGNVYFASGGAGESLSIPSGTITLAPGAGSGIATSVFNSITIAAGAGLFVPMASSHANRTLVQTTSLSLAGSSGAWTSSLDLSDNDLDVTNGSLGDLTSQVAQGYTTGTTGIFSSTAAADSTHLTTLGVIQNSGGDVLVKYTYFGDANANGTVDSVDYTLIDNGYLSNGTSTGWSNGDFNYDGVINGSDYTLIDNAFNQQGASLAAQMAGAKPAMAFASSQIDQTNPYVAVVQFSAPSTLAAGIFGGDDSGPQSKLKKKRTNL